MANERFLPRADALLPDFFRAARLRLTGTAFRAADFLRLTFFLLTFFLLVFFLLVFFLGAAIREDREQGSLNSYLDNGFSKCKPRSFSWASCINPTYDCTR